MSLRLRYSRPFQLHGRVVRQEFTASGYGPGGIGVQLLFPDAETRDRFGRRIDQASLNILRLNCMTV